MKILTTKLKDSLLDSLKYGDTEILNTTKKWNKKSPVLFPSIASGKIFKVNDVEYKIPRHGFWNDIDFQIEEYDNNHILRGKIEHPSYPFYTEVDQYILVKKNTLTYRTTFTGPEIPIQFGYHPGFNYDKGGLKIKQDNVVTVLKDFSVDNMNIDINNINELPWDKVDTFIFETNKVKLENNEYDLILETNMKYIAVWTNGDKYICLEPWSNLPAMVTPNDNTIMNSDEYTMSIRIEEK